MFWRYISNWLDSINEIWLVVPSWGGNLDSGVQIEQLLTDLIGGEANGDHWTGPEVIDGHAAVQALHDAVLLVYERDGTEHAAAEPLRLGVHHCELHAPARHIQRVRNALRHRPRQPTTQQFRRHRQHQIPWDNIIIQQQKTSLFPFSTNLYSSDRVYMSFPANISCSRTLNIRNSRRRTLRRESSPWPWAKILCRELVIRLPRMINYQCHSTNTNKLFKFILATIDLIDVCLYALLWI